MKALAFRIRGENKDAYDLVYVLRNFEGGPAPVAAKLAQLVKEPDVLSFGSEFRHSRAMPFEPILECFGAELSERPLDRLAYRGAMFRFDMPVRFPGD